MGFEAHVQDMKSAANKLAAQEKPALSAQGAPNVGETSRAAGYRDDYDVWLLTRKEDLAAAQQQVESLVESIKGAAESYAAADSAERDVFMKALDTGFDKIDR